MSIQFFPEKVLLQRLKSDKKGITFLFGSALSAIKDGSGIPNVEQVSEIIKEYASEHDQLEYYTESIQKVNEKDRYQESFALLGAILGPDSTNEIVERVVKSNEDLDTGKQRIPQAIKDFVRCIKEKKIKVNNILTTNFDTLIEEQLENEGITYNSFSLVSDSHLSDIDNGNINIIHLHGVWNKGDTMHTKNQLLSERKLIESSLQNLLQNQPVVIMAYSGWIDSFTRSLASIVCNDQAKYNLVWCFYENNNAIIEKGAEELFDTLTPAMNRGRVQFFNDIDCNSIFSKLSAVSELKKKEIMSES
jgi:hypothetical protein